MTVIVSGLYCSIKGTLIIQPSQSMNGFSKSRVTSLNEDIAPNENQQSQRRPRTQKRSLLKSAGHYRSFMTAVAFPSRYLLTI